MEANTPTHSMKEKPSDGDSPSPTDTEAAEKPAGPPNGGTLAWLQVAGAFVLFFNTWYGIVNLEEDLVADIPRLIGV